MSKEYRKLNTLKNWEQNPRYKNLMLGWGWNKGKGMSFEDKAKHRKETLSRYNNKPERKIAVKLWHQEHKDRVIEIKKQYANSEKGIIKRKETSHRRIAREKSLKKPINWAYFWWLCERMEYFCIGCGKQYDKNSITIDHQLPINKGGDNDEWNLIPLCRHCNSRKQDRLLFLDNWYVDYLYGEWLENGNKVI